MKGERRIVLSIFWLVLGCVLMGFGIAGKIDNVWSGMGGGLVGVSILQIIRFTRYKRDAEYREKYDTEISDERNRFIRNRAWTWAGYLFVIIAALAVIVLRLMGQEMLSMAASYAVCLILLLYWISYMILKRKY